MLLAAFMVGAVVMSLEMLASRYLNPYFGGTIFTWAALISVVLLAMMAGYFFGGYSADKLPFKYMLEVMIIIAGLYLVALPLFVDPLLEWVVGAIYDVKLGALIGALIITGPPVACLSTFSPIAIRRTLRDLEHTGRISGTVFAISTAGNIFGTLLTSFYLIPHFGTRTLTMWLAVVLVLAGVIVLTSRRSSSATVVIIAIGLFLGEGAIKPTPALAEKPYMIDAEAGYPEGPVFIGGSLYYTEMTRNRVMKLGNVTDKKGPKPFFYQKGCGPTSLARYQSDKIVILCHLSDELIVVDAKGKLLRQIKKDQNGTRIFHPNDCIKDDQGGVYISAPGHFSKKLQPMGRLFYLSNEGIVTELANKLTYPNGVAIHKGILYLSEHLAGRAIKFPITGQGTIGKSELFTDFHDAPPFRNRDPSSTGPDGIEISDNGTIYIAEYARGRILIYGTNGKYKNSIHTRLPFITNMAIDKKTGHLIITGARELSSPLQLGSVYSIIP